MKYTFCFSYFSLQGHNEGSGNIEITEAEFRYGIELSNARGRNELSASFVKRGLNFGVLLN